jgi:hypothetical protein
MADEENVRIFSVETRFQSLAKQPGGIPREAAIQAATAKIEELKPGFDDWVESELQSLADALSLAQQGKQASEWIEAAERHARHVRDVGTTMGSELLTFIADSLCSVLEAIETGAECNIESITCHADALMLARKPNYRGLRPDQVPELTNGLRRVANRLGPASV